MLALVGQLLRRGARHGRRPLVSWRLWTLCMIFARIAFLQFSKGDYSANDAVVVLTEQNFEQQVLQSSDYWLVEFYAPWCGHCQKLEPEFKAAAKKLKSHARLGAVDATAHQALAQKYGIKGYPTIKEFGIKKKKPTDYQGGRTKKDIVAYVKNSVDAQKLGVGSASIATLDFANVQTFLTQHEGVPSAIFFGSRSSGSNKKAGAKAPSWISDLAQKFTKGKKKKRSTVQIGFVPGNEGKVAKQFGIEDQALPALVFVDATNEKFTVADLPKLSKDTAQAFIQTSMTAETAQFVSLPMFPTPQTSKKAPSVQLHRFDADKLRACADRKSGKMCVVVASTGPETDSMVKTLAKKYRRDPFKFLVADSKDDATFQVLGAFVGQPESLVVVLKPGRKLKYAALGDSSDELAVTTFLDKIIDGSSSFSVVSSSLTHLNAALDAAPAPKSQEHEEL